MLARRFIRPARASQALCAPSRTHMPLPIRRSVRRLRRPGRGAVRISATPHAPFTTHHRRALGLLSSARTSCRGPGSPGAPDPTRTSVRTFGPTTPGTPAAGWALRRQGSFSVQTLDLLSDIGRKRVSPPHVIMMGTSSGKSASPDSIHATNSMVPGGVSSPSWYSATSTSNVMVTVLFILDSSGAALRRDAPR